MAEEIGWTTDESGRFTAAVQIQELSDPDTFSTAYQLYLEQWQGLAHPTAARIDRVTLNVETPGEDEALKVTLGIRDFDGYEASEKGLPALVPLEKIIVLKQTLDLAALIHQCALPSQAWKLSHLYLHRAGCCCWLPLSPQAWVQRPAPANWLDGVLTFVLELFNLPVPETEYEWQEFTRSGKMPWEWRLLLKQWYSLETTAEVEIDATFRFIFLQAWIYSLAVQLVMGSSMDASVDAQMDARMVSSSQFTLLQKLRTWLGLQKEAAEAIELLSQKTRPSWPDLAAILSDRS